MHCYYLTKNCIWLKFCPLFRFGNTENLQTLPEKWKQLLSGVLRLCLEKYVNTIDEDRNLLKKENYQKLSRKRQFALHVRVGQKILLHKTLQAITKEPLSNSVQPGQGDHCCIAWSLVGLPVGLQFLPLNVGGGTLIPPSTTDTPALHFVEDLFPLRDRDLGKKIHTER